MEGISEETEKRMTSSQKSQGSNESLSCTAIRHSYTVASLTLGTDQKRMKTRVTGLTKIRLIDG